MIVQSAGAIEYTNCLSALFPGYDTKQFDGEVPVILKLWKMQSNSSLPSLLGPLYPGVVAPFRVLSMG